MSEDANGTTGQDAGTATESSTTDTDTSNTTTTGTPAAAPAGEDPAATIARLTAEVASARAEAGKTRVNAKATAADEARQQLTKDIAKALGLTKDGEQAPDPKALADQLAEQQAAAKGASVELAIYKHAATASADPSVLTDSRSFMDTVNKLDPTAADFGSKVVEAMKKHVEAHPRLHTSGQAPARSGAPLPGGSGGRTKTNPTLSGAVADHYGTAK